VILCISEFTERAVLGHFPAARGRTRVVPLGLPDRFGAQSGASVDRVLGARGLTKPYLLFVGQIAARKNLRPLVGAFRILRGRPEFHDLTLVLAGPVQTGGDEIVAEAREFGDSVRMLGFVGDDELPALYAGAAAFVFPGKGEGFGIPILEAMACGAPVVAARAGANPSTGGDAAVCVDPDSAEAFAEAISRVVTESAARADLVARGRLRAAKFTWSETARATVAAYRDAVKLGASA
jgi:glycosyltransferase involved in cell wall biosynthesis